jgi:hypothetical protein
MPKRRRADYNDSEVETITFSIPEDNSPLPSSSTTTPTPTTILSPPLSEQVFNVSEWTVETDRVSTSNTLFSSTVEPAPGMSFRESGRDLHIPGAYDNYYDVIDVSDFQPPPEPLQPSRSSNTESSKTSKVKNFSLIVILFNSFPSAIRYVAGWDTSSFFFWNSSALTEGESIKHYRPAADARWMNHTIDVEIVWEAPFFVNPVSSKAILPIHSITSRYVFLYIIYH